MDLSQRFHDKAGVIVIDKVPHPVDGVIPGAILILIFENEIQIPLRRPCVIRVLENLGSAREQKGALSGGVDDSAFIEWRV